MNRNFRRIRLWGAKCLNLSESLFITRRVGIVLSALMLVSAAISACSESAASRERRRTTAEPETRERRLEVASRPGSERPRSTTSRQPTRSRRAPSYRKTNRPARGAYSTPTAKSEESRSPLRRVEPERQPQRTAPSPGSVASASDSYVPSPANPPAPETSMRVYHVQTGDTLWGLANRFYGDSKHWRRILAANRNRVPDPRTLPVGIKLIIP